MQKLRSLFLRLLGGVAKEKLSHVEEELAACQALLEDSQGNNRDLTSSIKRLHKSLSEMEKDMKKNRELSSRQWTVFQQTEFPSMPYVPKSIQEATLANARRFQSGLRSLSELALPSAFSGEPAVGAFYRSLTQAGVEAHKKAKGYVDKNAVSRKFVEVLLAQVELHAKELDMEIGASKIFENNLPNLKEKKVGADFLLVVAGQALIQNGGARLFWVQTKVSDVAKSYEMNVYREPNKDGVAQIDALRMMHQPEQGMVGLYASFSPAREFSVGLPVQALEDVDSSKRMSCIVSLKVREQASRTQELLTALATASREDIGAFGTADELLAFLKRSPVGDAFVPLEVVSVTASPSRRDLELVQTVANFYLERLEAYHAKSLGGDKDRRIEDQSPKPPGRM